MDRQRMILFAVVGLAGIFLIFRVATGAMEHPFGAKGLGLWVAGLLTLFVFSFLGGDNPFYKFAEHLFVGVSAAYWMVTGFWTALVPNLFGKLFPGFVADYLIPGLREGGVTPPREWFYVIPLIFGILLLWRLAPKGAWISRWTLAFIVGITAGIRLIGFLSSDFLRQVKETMVPLVVFDGSSLAWGATFNNWVLVIGVMSGLCYFYFSKEHTGAFGRVARVGIWTLMITFGAGFGYTVMGRVALLVGRLEFLLVDWLMVASR
jgi:hypothetical protein